MPEPQYGLPADRELWARLAGAEQTAQAAHRRAERIARGFGNLVLLLVLAFDVWLFRDEIVAFLVKAGAEIPNG